jgi:hypothetical protein
MKHSPAMLGLIFSFAAAAGTLSGCGSSGDDDDDGGSAGESGSGGKASGGRGGRGGRGGTQAGGKGGAPTPPPPFVDRCPYDSIAPGGTCEAGMFCDTQNYGYCLCEPAGNGNRGAWVCDRSGGSGGRGGGSGTGGTSSASGSGGTPAEAGSDAGEPAGAGGV